MKGAAVFLGFTAIGIGHMCPGVSFGDAGELIAAASSLSIPHAPGYPLFTLVGKAVGTLVPAASWAYRVNLVSVLCGSASLTLLVDAMDRDGLPPAAGLAGVLLLGLSPLWLHTALQTEVFALNSLAASAAIWVLARYGPNYFDARPMAATGLILGLGGANHHTLILAVPALLAGGWFAGLPGDPARRLRKFKRAARGLGVMIAFGLLGLMVYLFLPIRARTFPPLDWGHPVDLERFLHVLLRRDYGSFSLTVEGASGGRLWGVWSQSARYFVSLGQGLGLAGTLAAAAGLAASLARKREGAVLGWAFPVLLVLVSGPGFLILGNPPFDPLTSGALERFHLVSWIGAAWLAAEGAARLEAGGRWGRAAVLALLAVPFFGAARTAQAWGQRRDFAAEDYGRNLLRSLPPGAAFFMDGGDDSFYTVAYLQISEGLRPDIEPHDRGGLVFPNPYGPDFRKISPEAKEKRRAEVEAGFASRRPTFYQTLKDDILPSHPTRLWGVLRRADPDSSEAGAKGPPAEHSRGRALWETNVRRFDRDRARAYYRYRSLVPLYAAMEALAEVSRGDYDRSLLRLRDAASWGADVAWLPATAARTAQWAGYAASRRGLWDAAGRAYRTAIDLNPEDGSGWANLGVTLEKRGRPEEAERAYREGLGKHPDAFQTRFNLGTLYWKQARWAESAREFDLAAALRPDDPETRKFAALARRRSGP